MGREWSYDNQENCQVPKYLYYKSINKEESSVPGPMPRILKIRGLVGSSSHGARE